MISNVAIRRISIVVALFALASVMVACGSMTAVELAEKWG